MTTLTDLLVAVGMLATAGLAYCAARLTIDVVGALLRRS